MLLHRLCLSFTAITCSAIVSAQDFSWRAFNKRIQIKPVSAITTQTQVMFGQATKSTRKNVQGFSFTSRLTKNFSETLGSSASATLFHPKIHGSRLRLTMTSTMVPTPSSRTAIAVAKAMHHLARKENTATRFHNLIALSLLSPLDEPFSTWVSDIRICCDVDLF
ncbi:hypothetical protein DL98DRAFT_534990 [Cadophora sp. DSE1049]|nr:hypothetical protein DL98DRAFT_534990 [Cadophora sp. DSE1049]